MTDREINVLVIRTLRGIENIEACMAYVRQGLREGAAEKKEIFARLDVWREIAKALDEAEGRK